MRGLEQHGHTGDGEDLKQKSILSEPWYVPGYLFIIRYPSHN